MKAFHEGNSHMGFRQSFRSQSAMEYLMTYGWAILIIAVVLAALFELGVFNPMTFAPKASPGSCQVVRPEGAGTTNFISLEGECNGELPQYVTTTMGGPGVYTHIPNPSFNYSETFWFLIPPYSTSSWYPLTDIYNASVNGGSGGGQNYDYGGLWVNGGKICLLMENWPNSVELGTCSPYTTVPNTWYFVAISGNWIDETLYVNGSAVSSGSMSNSTIAQAQSTLLRPTISFYTNPPGGLEEAEAGTLLANAQLYDASLSTNDIQAIYQEGIGGAPIKIQSLIGWWPLNGNANDYSGNGNNGVPSGITYTSSWYSGYSAP